MIMTQEYQKSRRDWINCGDRNTRFFHQKTIHRRRVNRIVMLKNNSGEWVQDMDQLKSMAI